MQVAIIGGGAAGFFAAIHVKINYPNAEVILFEKSKHLLSKVRISGGGRCNVTNASTSIKELSAAYPRGGRFMKKALSQFSTTDTREWFTERGVKTYAQEDGRVFPTADNSEAIIACLMKETKRLGIYIQLQTSVTSISFQGEKIKLQIGKDKKAHSVFDYLIVATGGSPKLHGFQWLASLGLEIIPPVPSLFTFNMPGENIRELMGVSVANVILHIQQTDLRSEGPLLITHWGMSGPAVLKLSAFGARQLAEVQYQHKLQVNWTGIQNQQLVYGQLQQIIAESPAKQLGSVRPFSLADRLWQFLLNKSGLPSQKRWNELGKKGLNKLTHLLCADVYQVSGKTTFKEEFVTCGGVCLSNIDGLHMRSKQHPRIYFAGEVLDIDGITGGYNFQAAWTTAFLAAKLG